MIPTLSTLGGFSRSLVLFSVRLTHVVFFSSPLHTIDALIFNPEAPTLEMSVLSVAVRHFYFLVRGRCPGNGWLDSSHTDNYWLLLHKFSLVLQWPGCFTIPIAVM